MNGRELNGLNSDQVTARCKQLLIRLIFPVVSTTMAGATGIAISFGRGRFLTVFIGAILSFAVIWLIVILGACFKVVDRAVTAFFSAVQTFVLWWVITAVVLMVFAWVSQWILDRHNLALQVPLLVVWGSLLGFALLFISSEKRRANLFRRLKPLGYLAPLAYSVNVLLVAVLFFSATTYVLVDHGFLRVNPINGSNPPPLSYVLFYFWHFVDSVPVLKIN